MLRHRNALFYKKCDIVCYFCRYRYCFLCAVTYLKLLKFNVIPMSKSQEIFRERKIFKNVFIGLFIKMNKHFLSKTRSESESVTEFRYGRDTDPVVKPVPTVLGDLDHDYLRPVFLSTICNFETVLVDCFEILCFLLGKNY
jgi:hypothetical protein